MCCAQVYLVHSCGSEQRVSAELCVDSSEVTLAEVNGKVKVKVSIPADYAMDVYVAPQDNASSVAGRLARLYLLLIGLSCTAYLQALTKKRAVD